ncbi:MAG: class II fructose-bisphosphate aldolase [Sphaerochaetaceae bacterium]|nr:class II fructose-bisphosphate aldolase [Sphaerochaetaceae bacterium]MDD2406491.1 class II fructose-bisphosphate aldolase [Sphaerochaetaceae bacterium]
MPIVTTNELLIKAREGNYAVAAFNTNNLEYTQAIVQAASELHAPVIVAATEYELHYMGGYAFVAMVKAIARDVKIPIAIHLDHGPSYEEVIRCLRYGMTSVMYDGSLLPLEQNIANTRKIVEAAHACGVTVEGEIGVIGQAADAHEGEGAAIDADLVGLADPDECVQFVQETKVDSFAAAIGNAHGLYKRKPELHFELLDEIYGRTNTPLVLHGGTGIPTEDVQKAITKGVAKINFSTVMRKGVIEALRASLDANPNELNYMKLLAPATQRMVDIAKEHINMCMSEGKA